MTNEQIKEISDRVIDYLREDILSYEDDWVQDPLRSLEEFSKNYIYADD